LYLVFIGYASGILHKYLHAYNWVIYLYALNLSLVLVDIILVKYYNVKNKKTDTLT
jgi:hypothetical protein